MKQIIVSKCSGATTASARYTWLFAIEDGGLSSTETSTQTLWSAAGTLRKFKVKLSEAPGSGKSVTFVIRKNGSDTALTVTISDTDTEAVDSSNTVTVAPGDLLGIQRTASASVSGTMVSHFYVEFDGDNTGESSYGWTWQAITNGGTLRYNSLFFNAHNFYSNSDSSFIYRDVMPAAGTITRLDFRALDNSFGPLTSGKDYVFTVYKNGVKQDGSGGTPNTSVTLNDGTSTGSWTGTLTVAAGDYVWVELSLVGSWSLYTSYVSVGARFTATTDGDFLLASRGALSLDVDFPVMFTAGWSVAWATLEFVTEQDMERMGGPTTFYVKALRAAVATGGGNTWTLVGRLNQTTPSPTVSRSFSDVDVLYGLMMAVTTTSPGGSVLTVTDSDMWAVMATVGGVRGSAVFGVTGTVQAPRAVLFSLDGNVNTHATPGAVKICGDLEVTGAVSSGANISDDLDGLGT